MASSPDQSSPTADHGSSHLVSCHSHGLCSQPSRLQACHATMSSMTGTEHEYIPTYARGVD